MKSNLQKMIVDDFGSEFIQKRYIKNVNNWLWESERLVIQKYLKPKSKILDMACWTWRSTIQIHSMGFDVIGADITPQMIENAKKIAESKKVKITYEVQDATKMTYKDNSFDGVLFFTNGRTQIPWNDKRFKALQEIYRVLEKWWIFILIFHAKVKTDYSYFWFWHRIKHNIFKRLGIKIWESDYWDMLFNRENGSKQFMHIANEELVKDDLKKIWFKLLFYDREDKITNKDLNWNDNVYNQLPMFAICKKG